MLPRIGRLVACRGPAPAGGERDIREALQVQPDNTEVEGLLDEQVGLAE